MVMKLIDDTNGKQLIVGDTIRDDNGTVWFILGYSNQGWVQLVENDKLGEIAKKYNVDSFALKVEEQNV